MFDFLDPLLLARIQFAFTIAFHIIFPAFTIGLASWLVVLEALWLKTSQHKYREIYQMWVKIFAVAFGMGVVSGIVMSYQFGTNWSVFSDKAGNVIGPIIGFEVLTAFFVEASFLGIMLFGWNRVSKKMHFVSTMIVALGTLMSAFWILSANSWMHTPAGFTVDPATGVLYPANWLDIVFNPSFPYRLMHMVLAAYLTTAFVIGGVGAYYLARKIHIAHAKVMLAMAMLMAIFVTPLQILVGDMHGLNTLHHQPAKVAAIEAIWETQTAAPLTLFGIPDAQAEKTRYAIEVPRLGSIILTHSMNGEILGLKEWPREDRPPVAIPFFGFRIMVAIGSLMLLTGLIALLLFWRKTLYTNVWFHRWCMFMSPSGFIAVISGWMVTEVGRQPYIIYNVLRTSEAASPVIAEYILVSLLAFIVTYLIIFGAGLYYILHLIGKGPDAITEDAYGAHGMHELPIISDVLGAHKYNKEGKNV